METVFAKMESADFYPGDLPKGVMRIVCTARNDIYINAGEVVIMELEKYNELVKIATDKLTNKPT